MRVSEICVNQIRVNQGLGVFGLKVKSTQYKKGAPNALRFTHQNLKFCKPHEKTKQKTSKC